MALSIATCFRLSTLDISRVLVGVRHLNSKVPTPVDEAASIPELQDPEERKYYSSYDQPTKGKVYDKKPFKFLCKAGKAYHWCCCGYSHTQPFCDGTHASPFLKIKLRPVRFICKETREYWFCNCKQTNRRPFCDGTHKCPGVQEAQSTIKW